VQGGAVRPLPQRLSGAGPALCAEHTGGHDRRSVPDRQCAIVSQCDKRRARDAVQALLAAA